MRKADTSVQALGGEGEDVQLRYGALGLLCLFLLGVGIKARNTACLSAEVLVFALLVAQG
ncbi:hypothetical protein ACFY5F_36560 [Streptomyces sp. NPDC013161]|uniref:hypothetical protein n=1 Tax=Streptomyces sp. NPDC013161 TaxID=3364862 RepID=UPI0036CC132E